MNYKLAVTIILVAGAGTIAILLWLLLRAMARWDFPWD